MIVKREIAYLTFGRNALIASLISHIAALLAGMMSGADVNGFSSVLYLFSWAAFILGVYIELKNRGYAPLGDWRFFLCAIVNILPVLGPLAGLFMLYALQGDKDVEGFKIWDMVVSLMRLRANLLVIFLLVATIFALFALALQQNDAYFKKVRYGKVLLTGDNSSGDIPTQLLTVVSLFEEKYELRPSWQNEMVTE